MANLKFSGHETFHCRQQWLYKGVDSYAKHSGSSFFGSEGALVELGVGKNMVRSIQFWMKAMSLLNQEDELTELGRLVFNIKHEGGDPYLEKEGSLWLLHYLLCSTKYASIYNLVFREYFHDRARETFTREQLVNFLNRKNQEITNTSEQLNKKTIDNDIKVFLKSYLTPSKKDKSFEDDFSALFIDLDLIREVPSQLGSNEVLYKMHRDIRQSIPEEIFLFALLNEISKEDHLNDSGVSFNDLNLVLGSIFSLSIDGLEMMIERTCKKYPNHLVYSSNAGVKELQFKDEIEPNSVIADYYA